MASVNDIRAGFLGFFKRHGHEVRPSASLLPHNDPTLMFTNAGMNQFKNVFTGAEKVPYARAASSQKCVRAGGKHNDLDNVGYTARHHTFFEMLGNFSFGDYFKEEAINLAWELLTKDYAISPDRLCVTVYHDDDVAWNHWKKITGFADHRIIRISTNDNFWAMGDTGPCGPCSEIFYDHGEHVAGGPPGSADADGDRFTEIWNLVFMQYEQVDADTRLNLPKPSIDTGMGLERIAAVLQGVHDNYDIDLFRNIIADIRRHAGSNGEPAAYKVIADHLRSSCFLIADGVMPSNEGRGYVLRRIMRRAMRYAHQLGCRDPLMFKLVPSLVNEMGGQYPELGRAQAAITESLKTEEEQFKRTLDRGLKLLEEETASLSKGQQLPGDAAFKLYDTYGFPLDLTQDILKGRGIEVDVAGFEKAMEGQRDMARAAWTGSGEKATGKIWFELKERLGAVLFLGYEQDEADAKVLAIVKGGESVPSAGTGDEAFIVLDRTPFYGESGGQIGDTGFFYCHSRESGNPSHKKMDPRVKPEDDTMGKVLDTQKPLEDFIVHKAKLSTPLKVGDTVHAAIDGARRTAIRANHSATHLLHKALRETLGEHVTQKGSLVAPDRLRFDFSHPKGMTREEIAAVESKVNAVIRQAAPVGCEEMAPDDAIKAGAMALFGEKYGEKVRVLSMGISDLALGIREENTSPNAQSLMPTPYSVELCGGTHVKNTGDIGLFKIVSEGSVASGIRRIEAVTGEGVRAHMAGELEKQHQQIQKLEEENQRLLAELASPPPGGGRPGGGHESRNLSQNAPLLTSPLRGEGIASLSNAAANELPGIYEQETARQQKHMENLQENNKKLSRQLAEAKKQKALATGAEAKMEKIGNIQFIGKIFDGLDPKELRGLAEQYLKQIEPGIVFVGAKNEGKASIVVGVDKFLTDMYNAVTLLQKAVEAVGGKGGGGKPMMAQGGGPDADKLEAALNAIRAELGK